MRVSLWPWRCWEAPSPKSGKRWRKAVPNLFSEAEVFDNTVMSVATVDRLIDNSTVVVIEGQSYRRRRRGALRWLPFTGQVGPLKSLTLDGWDRVRPQYRPLGEFCLPGSYGVLHGNTSRGSGPG